MTKNKNDIILDQYVETQGYLERFNFGSSSEYVAELEAITEDLADRIANTKNIPKKRRLKTLYNQSNAELARLYAEYGKDLQEDMEIAAGVSYKGTQKAFKDAHDMESEAFDKLPAKAIEIFTSLSIPIALFSDDEKRFFKPDKEIKKLLPQHQKQFRRAINKSLALGLGIDESVRQFKREAGKINNLRTNHINSITRTTIADSMSRSREYCEDKNFADVIEGYQHVTVLDTRTSKICAARAGVIKKKREDFNGVPPLHFRCRSILVPVTSFTDTKNLFQRTRTWDEKITATNENTEIKTKFTLASDKMKNIKLPDQRTNRTAFDVWFDGLPKERQIQWLGPQKYKLWKSGKIGTKSLVDGNGKVRTVKELARLVGVDSYGLKEIKRRNIKAYQPEVSRNAKKVFEERKKI